MQLATYPELDNGISMIFGRHLCVSSVKTTVLYMGVLLHGKTPKPLYEQLSVHARIPYSLKFSRVKNFEVQ